MKIVQINATCGVGSTGKICISISRLLTQKGIENYIFYTEGHSDYPLGIKYSHFSYKKLQALKARVLGNGGFNSHLATRKLLQELECIQPDIIHIHNIHGHDCHLQMLFSYLKQKKIKVFWTFHDCWAFTANCPHFTFSGCDQWKTGCHNCPQIRQTSWFFDRSQTLFRRKKELFSGLDLTILTPSQWLANLVKESFLKDYPVQVIPNGIDLNVFRPAQSNFRKKYGLGDKSILLGVAYGWGRRKGLDVFCELSRRLDDRFQIVLVGTDNAVDGQLPSNILSIHRTQNQQELAEIYTAADLFVNPTREDTYPTVNLEALACGTPVITFDTGGSPECIGKNCGTVVACDDVDGLEQEILSFLRQPFSRTACLAQSHLFDMHRCYEEYLAAYERCISF